MDLGLEGKTALVTGASKGIGYATARALAAEGVDVAISARGALDLEKAAKSIEAASGRRALPLVGDMGVTADIDRCVASAIEGLGHLDIVVTCAGSSPGGLLEELDDESWMASLALKFFGYVRTIRAVLPHMRERRSGSIVAVVGNDGLKSSYWEITAGAANAADINFVSSIAEQYARFGIRINTVNPGPVDTERWDRLEKALARDKGISQAEAHARVLASLPLGYICSPEEVADVVAFVASARASYLNGAHIVVDGGQRKAIIDA